MTRTAPRSLLVAALCVWLVPRVAPAARTSGGSAETTAGDTAEVEQVRCSEIAFSRSVETGDWDAFKAFVHPEARFASSEAIGPEDVTAKWRGAFGSDALRIRWRPRSVEILEPGRLALSRGPYRVVSETADGPQESWGSFNSVWSRTDAGWKVVFDIGSEGIRDGDKELLQAESSGCSD